MKNGFFWLVVFLGGFGFAQTKQDTLSVRARALDYVEGWYTADASRMERAVHPKLSKCRVSNETSVSALTASQLVAMTASGTGRTAEENCIIDMQILDLTNNRSSVLLSSFKFFDMLNLVKIDTSWKILNVLWDYHTAKNEGSTEELEQAVNQYAHALQIGDRPELSSLLHPQIAIRRPISLNEVDELSLEQFMGFVQSGQYQEASEGVQIEILAQHLDCASVKVIFDASVDYLQLCYKKGQWWIVKILWNRETPLSGIGEGQGNPPEQFQLYPNYPNPFNPSTQIAYSLVYPSPIRINILNSLGELIRSYDYEMQAKGRHVVCWDGCNSDATPVASGLYYCQLKSEKLYAIRKMVLIR